MRLGAPLWLAAVLALPGPASADCDFSAPRTARVEAAGARSIRVVAGAGSLRIEGRPGADRVEVRGTACATSASLLERIRLRAERRGPEVFVEADIPDGLGFWSGEARLDLEIEVPAGMRLDVEDGSGAAQIRGAGSVSLDDGSGDLLIEDIAGEVRVTDGSGDLRVFRIGGEVRIRDGSGGIEVRDVGGPVIVEEDGSGAIDLQDVRQGVTIRRDGSGRISVRGVGGDFVVERDGSGGIVHRDVAGAVRVPKNE